MSVTGTDNHSGTKTPDTVFDVDKFFARLLKTRSRLLMLDYDGTLAPFNVDPARAVPYPGIIPLLNHIANAGDTRMVIVSGRWTRDLVPLLGLHRMPEIWGSHGWERLRPGENCEVSRISQGALSALVDADDWVQSIEALGARCERKPAGIAFHWRGLGEHQVKEILAEIKSRWIERALGDNLYWHDFDGGIELRAPGRNKGDVVRTLKAEAGPDAALAYFGDDMTDEQAFEAVGPDDMSVLVRPQWRRSKAKLWLKPPDELLACLRRWIEVTA